MKKIISIIILSLLLSGCKNDSTEEQNTDWNPCNDVEWLSPNSTPLSSEETYTIDELECFLGETSLRNTWQKKITLEELNTRFPIKYYREIPIQGELYNYVVYPVTEGGTIYVTFGTLFPEGGEPTQIVHNWIYINPKWFSSESLFENIVPNSSTFNDVYSIAPMTVFITHASSSPFSYSLLNEKTIVFVEYYDDNQSDTQYIVKEIEFLPRDGSNTLLGAILADDLLFCN